MKLKNIHHFRYCFSYKLHCLLIPKRISINSTSLYPHYIKNAGSFMESLRILCKEALIVGTPCKFLSYTVYLDILIIVLIIIFKALSTFRNFRCYFYKLETEIIYLLMLSPCALQFFRIIPP